MGDTNEEQESRENSPIDWDRDTQEKFGQLIAKIPVFLRSLAKEKVLKRAETIVKDDHRTIIVEKDMVDAFLWFCVGYVRLLILRLQHQS